MKTAAVIIPTTGRESLRKAVESVLRQSFPEVECIVVVDGAKHGSAAFGELGNLTERNRVAFCMVPYNTGANYWNGHRIYGATPFLLPHDYIFYLDDDNTFEPYHVANCIDLCESKGLDWCCSFRNIYEGDTFVCRDECESLGKWRVWFADHVHVDTSCYCLRREVAVEIAPMWHRPAVIDGKPVTSPDTLIANHLAKTRPKFDVTGQFTVNYRLGSQDITPKAEFFLKGNETYRAMYPEGLPWMS